jgi:hypothetical protein
MTGEGSFDDSLSILVFCWPCFMSSANVNLFAGDVDLVVGGWTGALWTLDVVS